MKNSGFENIMFKVGDTVRRTGGDLPDHGVIEGCDYVVRCCGRGMFDLELENCFGYFRKDYFRKVDTKEERAFEELWV